jgi:hypothetical protein
LETVDESRRGVSALIRKYLVTTGAELISRNSWRGYGACGYRRWSGPTQSSLEGTKTPSGTPPVARKLYLCARIKISQSNEGQFIRIVGVLPNNCDIANRHRSSHNRGGSQGG